MKKAVVFDIDGVLAQKHPDRDYREYDKVDMDFPIQHNFNILYNYINDDIEVIYITGRKALCKNKTIHFITKKLSDMHTDRDEYCDGCYAFSYLGDRISDLLFMRGDEDHRPSDILKKEIYENHIKNKYDVVAVYDDDPKNCVMFRDLGLHVFQVMR